MTSPSEIARLRELAAAGNVWAQKAAASFERMNAAPRGSKSRRHHRRAFASHKAKALATDGGAPG